MVIDELDQFDAVTVWQVHVREAEIKSLLFQQCPGAGDVLGACSVDAHTTQRDLQELPDIRFVINNQCFLVRHAR